MNGLNIFTHSFRQVVGNLGMAVRVSGGVWLLLFVLGIVTVFIAVATHSPFLGMVLMIAFLVAAVWGVSLIAVVWHRYILMEEAPSGFIPSRKGLHVWLYFWSGIGISLIVLLIMAVLFFAATIFVDSAWIFAAFDSQHTSMLPEHIALRWGVGLLVTVIYLRFALALPAVALGERVTFGESWQESKPYFAAIIVLSIVLNLLNAVAMLVLGVVLVSVAESQGLTFAVSLLVMLFQWFYFMLNISILSTLYGHIVEKREVY